MKKRLACAFLLAVSTPALAWNEKGHLVTAWLAWRQLTEEQRAKVVAVLKKHPHYEEYLLARRPEGASCPPSGTATRTPRGSRCRSS